jgi:hypothetical protein
MRVCRRIGLALVSALLLSNALLAPGESAPPPLRASFALTASPSPSIAGETLALTGRLSTSAARPVVLQNYTGGSWRKVTAKKSTSTGRFSFSVTAPASSRKYRVVATRTSRYGAMTSATRTVTIVAQAGSTSMPSTAIRGTSFVATFTFSPPRTTRYVDVQERVGDTWETFDTYRMESDGTNRLRYGFDGIGTFTLRARARAWNGATAFATPPASVTTTMPPAERLMKVSQSGNLANPPRVLGMDSDGAGILWFRDDDGDGSGTYRLWDRTTRVSTSAAQPPSIPGFVSPRGPGEMTPDLRYGILQVHQDLPDWEDSYQLYLWDRQLNTATLVTHRADGEASSGQVLSGRISDDGRFVVFESRANDLVADDPTEVRYDTFLWDRTTDTVSLVSGPIVDELGPVPQREPAISPDGSYVLYQSNIRDFHPELEDASVMVKWTRTTGARTVIDVPGYDFRDNRELPAEAFSADGRWVGVYPRQAGGRLVGALLDTTDSSIHEVPWLPSPAADGTTMPMEITGVSADGSTVTGFVCAQRYDQVRQFLYEPCYVYVWERSESTPVLVTKHWDPDDWVRDPSSAGFLSANGRYLVFGSDSPDLIRGDSDNLTGDIYTWDRDWTS